MTVSSNSSEARPGGAIRGFVGALTRVLVPSYHRKRRPERTVAIVVPLSSRPDLTDEEEVSLRHLCHFLSGYDKYLIAPEGIQVERDGFTSLDFPTKFFGSAAAHAQLLLWPKFYRTFERYEYILMYHLDSLVLADEMIKWCNAGFDYIGAPWLPCSDTPWVKEPAVGNGGFALMKIESVLKVLHNRYRTDPASFWVDLLVRNRRRSGLFFRVLQWLQKRFPELPLIRRPVDDWVRSADPGRFARNNDFFWSFEAVEYLPSFKVAPVQDALKFAFEAAPSMCFEMNGRRLPFGCHAWAKFDRSFWEPYLLSPEQETAPHLPQRQAAV